MPERPFLAARPRPTDEAIAEVLGGAARCFDDLMDATSTFRREWNHSKASGWMLKTHDGKKALFYLVPLEGSFLITMTVRAEERIALLADARVRSVHEQLRAAKNFAEGHALQFLVAGPPSFRAFRTLLDSVIVLRAAARLR